MNPYQLAKLYSVSETIEYEYIYTTIFSMKIRSGIKIIKIVFCDFWYTSEYPKNLILPNTLLYFTMGYFFNSSIALPDTLLYLTTNYYFNKPLVLPNNLLYLVLGESFNQPIELPDTLLHLKMNSSYSYDIKLPNSLLFLSMKNYCDLKVLPKKLRFLSYDVNWVDKLTLPETLETIWFTGFLFENERVRVKKCIDHMPNSVKTIVFSYSSKHYLYFFENIPNSVKYIVGQLAVYCLKKIKGQGAISYAKCGKCDEIKHVKIGDNVGFVLGGIILFEIMDGK